MLLLESHHDVGFSMQPRTHAFLKIIYVLQGAGTLAIENTRESFGLGDCLVVPPGLSNWIEDDPGAASSLYICCVAMPLLSFDANFSSRFPRGKLKSDKHVANRVASHLRRLAYAQGQSVDQRPLSMVTETMRLVQVICDQVGHTPEPPESSALSATQASLIERYTRWLDERFFEATTIDAAAASLGLSRRAFTRAFSLRTGETWLHYVRRLAIQHAIRLLCETDRPIATIAFECGFNDLSTFYRQFKAHTKMSPADYRRQHVSKP